ncbi:transcription factor bHLH35 isoform X2 [Mercurialis annua]|uniref:transcription factor bHLH35 isoform X2 n=1 Tax=Mercurialis annua TaxID=3986 RepID=UPI00216098BB|nr:transcription factor bHLH35 isoform X2 [Mercurialis annua]
MTLFLFHFKKKISTNQKKTRHHHHHLCLFSSAKSPPFMELPIENIGDEYQNYWETKMFLHNEELDSWAMDEAFSYYDSSSPDGAASSAASKNIVSERNRRKKLNERLFALRAVVPNISKMDKASIIKDAIDYIQELHEQERRIQAEIMELESGPLKKNHSGGYDFEQELPVLLRSKKKKIDQFYDSTGSRTCPIEVLELSVAYMGEKTLLVSLTCSKRTDTMVKLCEVFENLKLKIITANITTVSGRLLKTVFIEADEDEKDDLKIKIETAIAALNDPHSPMSM